MAGPLVDYKSDLRQIAGAVLDEASQSVKVKLADPVEVEFSGGTQEVEIDAADGDNIAIADASTGETAEVVDGRLLVDTGVTTTTATIAPSTDFRVQTVDVTTVATALSFAIPVTSVTLKALNENAAYVKVGKSDVATNYYLLSPGESVNVPLAAASSAIYLVRDAGAGTYQVTVFAVN